MTSLVDNEKKKPERNTEGLLDCSTCDQKTHPSFFEKEEQCCDCVIKEEEKRVNFDLNNNEELYFNKNEPVSKITESKKKNYDDNKDKELNYDLNKKFIDDNLEDENDSEDEYENNEEEKNSENKAFVDIMINMQKMMKAQQEQMDNMNKLMQKFLESKKDI